MDTMSSGRVGFHLGPRDWGPSLLALEWEGTQDPCLQTLKGPVVCSPSPIGCRRFVASVFVPESALCPDWGLREWVDALLWTWTLSLAGSRDGCLGSFWSWAGEDLSSGLPTGRS